MLRDPKDRAAADHHDARRPSTVSKIRRPPRARSDGGRSPARSQLRTRRLRVHPFLGLRPNRARLRQFDRLKGTDHVVRSLVLEEALVEARAEVPVIAFVIFVAIKSPDAADDDETTDPIVPKITEVMKAEISAGKSPFKADVIVNDHLW